MKANKPENRPGPPFFPLLPLASAWIVLIALSLVPHATAQQKEDPLVAVVNGHEIRLSEVYSSIESLPLGDQIEVRDELDTFIEAMVNEEVLFQWAVSSDFAGAADLRKEVKDLVVRHLIEKYVRSRISVSDDDALAYYKANPSLVRGEHVRVRRILLSKRAQCVQMMAQIDSEEEFTALAKGHSLDKETAPNGGDTGLIMKAEGAVRGYELEYFKMKVGEMRVFDVPEGCMLVRVIFYTNPPLPPFPLVRDNIKQYLQNRQEVMLVEKMFQEAGKDIPVERIPRPQ